MSVRYHKRLIDEDKAQWPITPDLDSPSPDTNSIGISAATTSPFNNQNLPQGAPRRSAAGTMMPTLHSHGIQVQNDNTPISRTDESVPSPDGYRTFTSVPLRPSTFAPRLDTPYNDVDSQSSSPGLWDSQSFGGKPEGMNDDSNSPI